MMQTIGRRYQRDISLPMMRKIQEWSASNDLQQHSQKWTYQIWTGICSSKHSMTVWLGFNIPNENLESAYCIQITETGNTSKTKDALWLPNKEIWNQHISSCYDHNNRRSSTYIRTVGVSSNNLTILWEFPDSVNLQLQISIEYTSKFTFTKVPKE